MKKITQQCFALLLLFFTVGIKAQLFQNGQSAVYAISSSAPNASGTMGTSATNLTSPVVQTCFAIDAKHGCVWVADYFGNRVLRFSYPITSNLPTANLVLGQTSFNTSSGGVSASSFGSPQGLAVDTASGTLYILCVGQNRVLRFNNAHTITTNGAAANAVFGQSAFNTTTGGITQNQFNMTQGPACGNLVHYDPLAGALWVSDNNNSRVLRFDNANNASSGVNASAVLGQTLYTTSTTGLSDTKFNRPDGLTTIGSSLFLADPANQRVLRFDNVYSKSNGAAADAVFGQTNFTSSGGGVSATKFSSPTDVTGDQNNLIVSDPGSSRILVFGNPLSNTTANSVLLSTSLTSAGPGGNSASTAGANFDIEYDGASGQLLVQDRASARILVFQSCPAIQIAGPTSICNGAAITLSASGVTSYTWNTSETVASINFTPTASGTYSVLGRFAGPTYTCFTSASKSITVNSLPIISATSGSICTGQNFTISPSGASTYTFSGGQVVSPSSTTNYSVSGTSASGCVSTNPAVITVTVDALPLVSVNSGNLCAGNNFTIVPTGASSYTIQGGNATVSPGSTSSYTVIGASANGCLSSNVATCAITVNSRPTIAVNSGSICSGKSFTIAPSGASTYTVQGGNMIVSPNTTSNYTVTGTSAQGCISNNVATVSLIVAASPTISVNSGTICAGNSFTILPNGVDTYTVQGGNTTISPLASTSYTVVGSSNNGCQSVNTATSSLVVNATPVITANSGSICPGANFVISPNGAQTYTVQGGTYTVTPMSNSSYTVRGTSAQGCLSSNTATASVVLYASPVISVNNATICSNANHTISPSGAASYVIQGGNAVVSPMSNTSYTITGTSADGCESANTATCSITVNTTPTVSVNSGTICSGSAFTIVPNGAATYVIEGGNAVVSPIANTSYTVIGTSVEGCISANTGTSAVTVNTTPTVSVNSGAICAGDNFTLIPSGAATYTIEGGNAIVSPNSTTAYTVVGASVEGCVSASTATSTIIINALPIITVNSGTICEGASFTIVPNGAVSYTVQGGNFVINPSTSSNYTVIGTSGDGCISNSAATASLTVNAKPVVTINNAAICNGNSYTLNPSGASTYSYSSGPVITPSLTSTYTITGTSLEGCEGNASTVTITVNNLPVVTVSAAFNQICLNDASVQITSNPIGGTFVGSTISNNLFTPTTTGNFNIVYVYTDNATGCSSSDTTILKVDACTGVTKLMQSQSVQVYPNPTKSSVTVKFEENTVQEIFVCDMLGRVLTTEHTSTIQNEFTFDLSAFSNGLYFVNLKMNNEVKTIKVIKE